MADVRCMVVVSWIILALAHIGFLHYRCDVLRGPASQAFELGRRAIHTAAKIEPRRNVRRVPEAAVGHSDRFAAMTRSLRDYWRVLYRYRPALPPVVSQIVFRRHLEVRGGLIGS